MTRSVPHRKRISSAAKGGVLDGTADQSAVTDAGEECPKVLQRIDHAGRNARHFASVKI